MFSWAERIKNCYFFLHQNNKFRSIFECSVKDVLVTYVTKNHVFRVNVFNMRLVIENICRAVPSFPSAMHVKRSID